MADVPVAFHVEQGSGERTLSMAGELDMACVDKVADAFSRFAGTSGDVTLEIEGLTFIDSSGVRALVHAAESLEDGQLVLEQPTEAVRRVLEIVGIAEASDRIVVMS